jgi:hypothetical protein
MLPVVSSSKVGNQALQRIAINRHGGLGSKTGSTHNLTLNGFCVHV